MDIDQDLDFHLDGGIATLTLNRPSRGNSLSPSMMQNLKRAWTEVRENSDIRVAIITGAGVRHFCTGADVARTARTGSAIAGNRPLSEEGFLTARQNRVWKPVICAVNGLAVGAGLHFVVDSDIVIASDAAAFMDTHVSVGMVGGMENIGLSKRLPLGTALRMSLMGKHYRLGVERAYQLGLVDEVTSQSELIPRAVEVANLISENSPTALALTKEAIWRSLDAPYQASLEFAWSLIRMHWSHPDYKEGPRAFVDKRSPRWQKELPPLDSNENP